MSREVPLLFPFMPVVLVMVVVVILLIFLVLMVALVTTTPVIGRVIVTIVICVDAPLELSPIPTPGLHTFRMLTLG